VEAVRHVKRECQSAHMQRRRCLEPSAVSLIPGSMGIDANLGLWQHPLMLTERSKRIRRGLVSREDLSGWKRTADLAIVNRAVHVSDV
jgi:hypothetical protein